MKASVYFTGREVEGSVLQDHTAVVIDVLRASSTIVAALAAGAQAIYPVLSIEDAIKLATSLGRKDALLAGERRGLKIEGFDLGNSPGEFTTDTVGGRRVVMSTTNGTGAVLAAAQAEQVVIVSFLNLDAVVGEVAQADQLAVVCAGREGQFSIEDALCAGMLLARLAELSENSLALEDAGRAVVALAKAFKMNAKFLAQTAAGRALAAIGLEEDVAWCAHLDAHDLVPLLEERMIRRSDGGGA